MSSRATGLSSLMPAAYTTSTQPFDNLAPCRNTPLWKLSLFLSGVLSYRSSSYNYSCHSFLSARYLSNPSSATGNTDYASSQKSDGRYKSLSISVFAYMEHFAGLSFAGLSLSLGDWFQPLNDNSNVQHYCLDRICCLLSDVCNM